MTITEPRKSHCKRSHPLVGYNVLRQDRPAGPNFGCRTCKVTNRRALIYGMTGDQLFQMWEDQDHRCACCTVLLESISDAGVDHDHNCCPAKGSCGKCVRGLLCSFCNSMLGYARDDISKLEQAIKYLKRVIQ